MPRSVETFIRAVRGWFYRRNKDREFFVSNRILVRFKDGITTDTRGAINAVYGCRREDSIPGIDVHVLTIPKDRTPGEMIRVYRRNPHVEFAEPDYIARAVRVPNDPHFIPHQENLRTVGAPAAWTFTTGNPDIVLAILDTGVTSAHPDLSARLTDGYNFIRNTRHTNDNHGHGTGVAGIIGAVTNNNRGIAGITWHNPLLPVKVLGNNGAGNYSTIARGITYATDRGARVINLSLGGAYESSTLGRAVQYAREKQAVVVAAVGNSGGPVLYPAAYPGVIAVGAVDANDQRTDYSNYGPEVSVTAPGNKIWSTTPNGDYGAHTGTSFAAPLVTGLAGLILSRRPELPPSEVKQIIEQTAADLGRPGWDKYYGWGRIDMGNALSALAST